MTDLQPDNPPAPGARRRRGSAVRTVATVVVAVVAVAFALYFGREVLIPIALSLVFMALLRPVVRALERLHLRTSLAAALVVLGALGVLVGAGFAIATPVQHWVTEAPQSVQKATARLGRLTHSFNGVAGVAGGGQNQQSGGKQGDPPASSAGSGMASKVLGVTTGLLAAFVEVLLLTWFLLASGDLFLRKLVHVLPLMGEKKRAVEVVHETEAVVSRYMLVSLLINLGQGTVVGVVMWLIGMPTPVLWGMMTLVLEFIPYLGATFMLVVLGLVGLATFDTVGRALLAPGGYLLISTLQNNLVSPLAYGRRLKLNPVAVLAAVMVWWFLWGVPGAFLAVPIVATTKVLADRVPGLAALGEFLGD